MTIHSNRSALFAALLTLFVYSAQADDTEIFFNQDPLVTGEPLVMFSIDYRPNLTSTICNFTDIDSCGWSDDVESMFSESDKADGTIDFSEMLRASLSRVLGEVSGIKVGLMLNHESINNCENSVTPGCSDGGYITAGFASVNGAAADGGEDILIEKLAAIPDPGGSQSHPFQGKELYFEFFRYLTGKAVYNGHVGFEDYGDSCSDDNLDDATAESCGVGDSDEDFPLISWDTSIESSGSYISPFSDSSSQCSRVFAVNFMFGVTNQDDDSDDAITAEVDGMTGIGLTGNNNSFDTVIEWMWQHDLADDPTSSYGAAFEREGSQNVTSYFFYNGNVRNQMDSYAVAGGTAQAQEISDDPEELVETLRNMLAQITRQNATFEAPAVTVNSYTRLTHRDELYYALFGPEVAPDWPGNLKKYKLIVQDSTGTLQIVDKNGLGAIDANGSVFYPTACSFWSDCSYDRDGDGFDDADGDTVEWGGAAGVLTSEEDAVRSRSVYVNIGGVLMDLHEDTSAITATMLDIDPTLPAADQATQRTRLLQIGRGYDATNDVALQTMGDPIHARPSVISYDDDASNEGLTPDMAVAMTTNEGFFHLIDADTGYEYFAFMPEEELYLLKAINEPDAYLSTGGDRFATYGLDGSPVVWRNDEDADGVIEASSGDHIFVYLTQRRGGRNVYAMDVTDRYNPILKWSILGGVTSGFSELGETWSEPALAWINVSGTPKAVLVFGGGYDASQDDAYSRSDSVGRAIYVVDADTGALIWSFDSTDISDIANSFPAPIKTMDVDEDGVMDRIYAVDVVGRVFRVDFDNSTTTTTYHGGGLVASLMSATCLETAPAADGAAEVCQRRFYNAPDIGEMRGTPNYIQIAVGSGFRAHPVTVTGIQDNFYVVFDENVRTQVATSEYATKYHWSSNTDIIDVTAISAGNTYKEVSISAASAVSDPDVHGWYINMASEYEEKVLSRSVTIQGKILFTTYLRISGQEDACTPDLGQGRVYVLDSYTGLPVTDFSVDGYTDTSPVLEEHRFKDLNRGGIPPDPVIYFDETGLIPLVGVEMPLGNLLGTNPHTKTWWIDVE